MSNKSSSVGGTGSALSPGAAASEYYGSEYYSGSGEDASGSEYDYDSDGSYSAHNRHALTKSESDYSSSSESEDEIQTKWDMIKWRLQHPFHKHKHQHVDPLAGYTKEQRRTFMHGSKDERAEMNKHPAVKWYESRRREAEAAQRRAERLAKVREQEERFDRLERMREFAARKKYFAETKEKDAARRRHESEARTAESRAAETRMTFFAEVGESREAALHAKEKEELAHASATARERFLMTRMEQRSLDLGAETAYLEAEAAQTQWVVERMRQTGLIPGIEAPPAPLPKEQRETTIRLVLRPLDKPAEHNKANTSMDSAMAAVRLMRQQKEKQAKAKQDADAFASKYGIGTDSPAKEAADGGDDSNGDDGSDGDGKRLRKKKKAMGARKSKRKQFFDVELFRFRKAEILVGERIGEKGGKELAAAFAEGHCPKCKELDLTWNLVKTRGLCALAAAWADGASKAMKVLTLQGNSIGPIPMRALAAAFAAGWNQLEKLDLRKNDLGNEGACTMAHSVLGGHLPQLRVLLMQSNDIADAGVMAVCKAFTAEHVYCPVIEHVNLRFNRISPAALRRFSHSARALHPALQL